MVDFFDVRKNGLYSKFGTLPEFVSLLIKHKIPVVGTCIREKDLRFLRNLYNERYEDSEMSFDEESKEIVVDNVPSNLSSKEIPKVGLESFVLDALRLESKNLNVNVIKSEEEKEKEYLEQTPYERLMNVFNHEDTSHTSTIMLESLIKQIPDYSEELSLNDSKKIFTELAKYVKNCEIQDRLDIIKALADVINSKGLVRERNLDCMYDVFRETGRTYSGPKFDCEISKKRADILETTFYNLINLPSITRNSSHTIGKIFYHALGEFTDLYSEIEEDGALGVISRALKMCYHYEDRDFYKNSVGFLNAHTYGALFKYYKYEFTGKKVHLEQSEEYLKKVEDDFVRVRNETVLMNMDRIYSDVKRRVQIAKSK